eukprot:RCo004245
MLYLIGLGLGHPKDLTYRAVELIKTCTIVYLEAYTSVMIDASVDDLEKFLGVTVHVADREFVEGGKIVDLAQKQPPVALLVVGDPFAATTHSDLVVRCHQRGLPMPTVVHNSSVLTAVGVCGLQLYRFGEAISLCLWTASFRPSSWYPKLARNRQAGLHTLCLLDIKIKELTDEQLARPTSRSIFDDPSPVAAPPPRFMTIAEAVAQLLEVEASQGEGAYLPTTLAVGLARLGSPSAKVVAGPLSALAGVDFGGPLHSLVLCGTLSDAELEHLRLFMLPEEQGA